MGSLDGRVVIVTGAGRGLGREHALLLAAEGARVVVDDQGGTVNGIGADASPAQEVAAEIRASGATAVASTADVADWQAARGLVELAVASFGDLDVLVNNAGILRDRRIWDLSEDEYDAVLRVNVKGHVAPTRWAAAYWKDRCVREGPRDAAIISTASHSGLLGIAGQSNYGASKAAIAAFAIIVGEELAPFGVRSNVIMPGARTRMRDAFREHEADRPDTASMALAPSDPEALDAWDPANVSPLVAYLASADCPLNGQVLLVSGGTLRRMDGWTPAAGITSDQRWTVARLAADVPTLFPTADYVRPPAPSPFA